MYRDVAIMDDALTLALDRVKTRRRMPAPTVRRHLRERAGLLQADLAKAVGASRAAVSRWESGLRTPRGVALDRYLAVLDRLAQETT